MTDICRLCLRQEPFSLNIFCELAKEKQILYKIQLCLPGVKVCDSDSLPNSVCFTCLSKLETTSDFLKQCLFSENVLRKETSVGDGEPQQKMRKTSSHIQINSTEFVGGSCLKPESGSGNCPGEETDSDVNADDTDIFCFSKKCKKTASSDTNILAFTNENTMKKEKMEIPMTGLHNCPEKSNMQQNFGTASSTMWQTKINKNFIQMQGKDNGNAEVNASTIRGKMTGERIKDVDDDEAATVDISKVLGNSVQGISIYSESASTAEGIMNFQAEHPSTSTEMNISNGYKDTLKSPGASSKDYQYHQPINGTEQNMDFSDSDDEINYHFNIIKSLADSKKQIQLQKTN